MNRDHSHGTAEATIVPVMASYTYVGSAPAQPRLPAPLWSRWAISVMPATDHPGHNCHARTGVR
jgi:hypothetical protein